MTAKRNGKIELLRFIFSICIVMYHINTELWNGFKLVTEDISFFSHGRSGVEFFFIVSGFLMAKSADKLRNTNKNISIGESTYSFILRKFKSVFTPHIIITVIMAVYLCFKGKLNFEGIIDRLPSVFFLQTSGISNKSFISVEWYICSMLFAMAVIYPFLLKSFDFVSKVAAPVGSVLLIGYMISKYNTFPYNFSPEPYISPCNLRGIVVVLLGVFVYAVCNEIKKIELSKPREILLVIVENLLWIFTFLFVISALSRKYEGIMTLVLAAAVAITFSRDFKSKLYNNSFVMYLGRVSLSIYLCQNFARRIVVDNIDVSSNKVYIVLITISTLTVGVILDFVCEMINKRALKRRTLK